MKSRGSIPACAGEPLGDGLQRARHRVYPRVCGGTPDRSRDGGGPTGLSPRVRGNRRRMGDGSTPTGSIPACAGEPPSATARSRRAWVYPRVCGGTHGRRARQRRGLGLSPRVRGNLQHGGGVWACGGSIPACAGEPIRMMACPSSSRVYPRVCGGTHAGGVRAGIAAGLSPRVRGNRRRDGERLVGGGSIPACAGEPACRRRPPADAWVYPRVCGGTTVGRRVADHGAGLSPRVRGNRRAPASHPVGARSIPACAGEPVRAVRRAVYVRVYPRVCGGTVASSSIRAAPSGLSPRVRGNLRVAERGRGASGSIPACAGEPVDGALGKSYSQVYPRVCGGTGYLYQLMERGAGLSPRVRGNLRAAESAADLVGSIPACAGEPGGARGPARAAWVYPRVCGGTLAQPAYVDWPGGLSPRVRGNRRPELAGTGHRGSIPACAGEPSGSGSPARSRRVYPRVCGGTSSP